MPLACALYGYEFTKSFEYNDLLFVPYHSSADDAHQAARDLNCYKLTGIIVIGSYDAERLFQLEAILSFIEHLDVLISDPYEVTGENYFTKFPLIARMATRHSGGGAVLHRDTFFPEIRSEFITIAMDRLADESFCELTGWKSLFFKTTIPFRQRNPYLEVSYFLLFSGLETYVRKTLGEPDRKDIGNLISRRLREIGFEIYPYKPTDLKRSADTYARLRNALFHNNSFVATRKSKKGLIIQYNLFDYYANFMGLVSLVVLKAIDFNHSCIHWDSWITMQR